MPLTQVTRTYLELCSPDAFVPATQPEPAPTVERLHECSASLFRELYTQVGRQWHWVDRLAWTDDRITQYLANPAISLWLMSWTGQPTGYFELQEHEDTSVEIVYFGLAPDYIGRGWGKYLLTRAVEEAWKLGGSRVWLHTCTLDHPAALPNYVRRGFTPFREEVYTVDLAAR